MFLQQFLVIQEFGLCPILAGLRFEGEGHRWHISDEECCCFCWDTSVHIIILTNHKFACCLYAFSSPILYSTLIIPCISGMEYLHIAQFKMDPNVKPSYRFMKWIAFEERLMWRKGRFGSIGKFIQTSSTIWQPMPSPLLSHAPKYHHTKYIQRLNMREMYLGGKGNINVSFLQNIYSSFLSHVLFA